jgi:hypothetical protein
MEDDFAMKQTKQNIKKKNKLKTRIIVIVIVMLIVLIGIVLLLFSANRRTFPQLNTVYTAMYNNEPILFYKYANMITAPSEPIGPSFGMYVPMDKALSPELINSMMNAQYVDFRQLQNPKKLFTFTSYATIENIRLSNDKTYMVISFIGGSMDQTNYIYQVNLKTAETKSIWQHDERTGNPPFNLGEAYVTQFIPNQYVVFDIITNNPPPGEMPEGTVILNMQTGNEKVLGVAGDVQVNLTNNKLSYKEISQVEVPCKKPRDPVCFVGDTYKYGYEPTGETHTQALP